MTRLCVSGSRKIGLTAWKQIWPVIRDLNPSVIIHGGAKGVDQIAAGYAKTNRIPAIERKPDYDKYHPKQAPHVRNKEMVEMATHVLIVYDTRITGGTENTLKHARKLAKQVTILDISATGAYTQGAIF